MKKLCLLVLVMAMALALSGCIVINVLRPEGASGSGSGTGVATAPAEGTYEVPDEDQDAELTEEDEELAYEVPRTIVPATDADQIAGVKVDFVIQDGAFGEQVDEVAEYSEDYLGKNLSMIGEVLHYDEPNGDTAFAIVRWYEGVHDEEAEGDLVDPETGLALEHSHDPIPTGFDCAYAGEIPQEKAWVRVVGTLEEYEFKDDETGEAFPALKLNVVHVEPVPEGQGGDRMLSWE